MTDPKWLLLLNIPTTSFLGHTSRRADESEWRFPPSIYISNKVNKKLNFALKFNQHDQSRGCLRICLLLSAVSVAWKYFVLLVHLSVVNCFVWSTVLTTHVNRGVQLLLEIHRKTLLHEGRWKVNIYKLSPSADWKPRLYLFAVCLDA